MVRSPRVAGHLKILDDLRDDGETFSRKSVAKPCAGSAWSVSA
ncbi:hypothetical protein [Arthrobacter sp. UYCu723]